MYNSKASVESFRKSARFSVAHDHHFPYYLHLISSWYRRRSFWGVGLPVKIWMRFWVYWPLATEVSVSVSMGFVYCLFLLVLPQQLVIFQVIGHHLETQYQIQKTLIMKLKSVIIKRLSPSFRSTTNIFERLLKSPSGSFSPYWWN